MMVLVWYRTILTHRTLGIFPSSNVIFAFSAVRSKNIDLWVCHWEVCDYVNVIVLY